MNINDRPRRAFRRRSVQIEATIRFRPPRTLASSVEALTLVGYTRNLSENGMALVVSASNIDRYLRQKENIFEVRLRLPNGTIELQALPVHYQRVASGGMVHYLIGSSFQKLDDERLNRLVGFLRALPAPSQ